MTATFYQVGGSVRDMVLGVKSKDIDYAVEAESFDAMRSAILERGGEIFLETPQYLTIRARVPLLGACDYVLCRKDGAYSDGRRPDSVEIGTIYDDLARRDFTVNAMALTECGNLIDPFEGERDCAIKWLRCVGSAETRLTEDGLRMLRALRFSITKGFTLDDHIYRCLRDPFFFAPRLKGVSVERIREELVRCFQYDTNETLDTLVDYGDLRRYLFSIDALWLKPTLEAR
jgi:tRNA nucleotidyltransferase (CCA-adding enzyme)